MKTITRTKIYLRTAAVILTAALALGIAPTAKADDKGCSQLSLEGTFAITTTGFSVYNVPAGAPFPPFAGVGTITFDGKGGGSIVGMSNANGTVSGNVTQPNNTVAYTVNPDCTGTFTVITRQGPSNWFFVLSDNWAELQAVCVDPYAVLTRVGRKLYPGRTI